MPSEEINVRFKKKKHIHSAFSCYKCSLNNDCLLLQNILVPKGTKLQEQIVIGTPGTVQDWCGKFKFFDPKKIQVFVLDEADVMIDTQGHQDQSIRIQRLESLITNNCRI